MDITEITLTNGFKKDEDICIKKENMETSAIIVKGDDTYESLENDTNLVTYRVVHVSSDNDNHILPHIVSSGNDFNATSVQPTIQTVLTAPVNNVYVIGPPNNEIYTTRQTNHKLIAPRTGSVVENRHNTGHTYRDNVRRVMHNAIERKRRDKINNWIIKLSTIIPGCNESSKPGYDNQSKGGILEKAFCYISDLKEENEKLEELSDQNEKLSTELTLKTKQLELALRENRELKMLLRQQEH